MFETSRQDPHDRHTAADVWSMRARLFVTHTETARLAPSHTDATGQYVDLVEDVAIDGDADHGL